MKSHKINKNQQHLKKNKYKNIDKKSKISKDQTHKYIIK